MQPTQPTQPTVQFGESRSNKGDSSEDEAYEAYRPGTSPASRPAGATQAVPGELSVWADVARFVGLLVPETFSAPPPAPASAKYPSLTFVKDKPRIVSVDPSTDAATLAEGKETERWFLHASPCERLHSLHPTAPRASALCHSPAADASAVGETGTVVYLGGNKVLTAFHVWSRLRAEDGKPKGKVRVVFGYVDPTLAVAPQQSSAQDPDPTFNGWVRPVSNVVEVVQEHLVGPSDPANYRAEEDWAILEIKDPGLETPPFEVNNMRALDWIQGRAVANAPDGSFDKKDRFEFGDLALIGHPLGVPKRLAEGGGVRKSNGRIFQHEVDSFSGNSGAPLFRAALGPAGPSMWLVGINLGGHDLIQVDDHLVPAACGTNGHYRPSENLAVDIREVLRRWTPAVLEVVVEEKVGAKPTVTVTPNAATVSVADKTKLLVVVHLVVNTVQNAWAVNKETSTLTVAAGTPSKRSPAGYLEGSLITDFAGRASYDIQVETKVSYIDGGGANQPVASTAVITLQKRL